MQACKRIILQSILRIYQMLIESISVGLVFNNKWVVMTILFIALDGVSVL